jgi:hypothetical protein
MLQHRSMSAKCYLIVSRKEIRIVGPTPEVAMTQSADLGDELRRTQQVCSRHRLPILRLADRAARALPRPRIKQAAGRSLH